MTVGHFHLFSTLSDSRTREVARQIQAFEETVGQLMESDDRLPDIPMLIYIVDHRDFEKYIEDHPIGGEFESGPFANKIVIDGDMDFDYVRVTVFHEYTHYIQRVSTSKILPPWYVEGYAELFSSFRLTNQKVTIGEFPYGGGFNLNAWIPVDRLLAVKQTDPEYRTERLSHQFYGEAWALVHLLLFDNRTLARPTAGFLDSLDLGIPEEEAFRENFHLTEAEMDKRLRKMISDGNILVKTLTYKNEIAVNEAPITRMTEEEADCAFLRLMFLLNRPTTVTAQVSATVLKGHPQNAELRVLMARMAAHAGDAFDVGSVVDGLVPGGLDDGQRRIDLADALVTRDGPADRPTAFALLSGVAQAPDAPIEAVALWAATVGTASPELPQVRASVERTITRVPRNTQLLERLAYLYELQGDKARARDTYNHIIVVSESPEQRLWAQKQADSARLH